MISEKRVWVVHISTGINSRVEENPGKLQLMKVLRPVIASKKVPYLQKMSVGLHSTSEMEKQGKKERIGRGTGS